MIFQFALIFVLANLLVFARGPVLQAIVFSSLVNELIVSKLEMRFRDLLAGDLAHIVGHGLRTILLKVLLGN